MLLEATIFVVCATLCNAGKSDFHRPCSLRDPRCVASNLAANSHCKAPSHRVPSEYLIQTARFETPYFNSSFIDNSLKIRNLDSCFVSEFYFNVASDTAVLTLDCPDLNLQSYRTLLWHRSFREDSVYSYKFNGTYPMIRLTTTFHPAGAIDLCNTFTFAEVAQLPIFDIDPNDRSTDNFLSRDLSQVNIFEIETFHYRAKSLARFYINRALCNFGCDY